MPKKGKRMSITTYGLIAQNRKARGKVNTSTVDSAESDVGPSQQQYSSETAANILDSTNIKCKWKTTTTFIPDILTKEIRIIVKDSAVDNVESDSGPEQHQPSSETADNFCNIRNQKEPSSLTDVRSHKKKKCNVVTIHTQVRSSARLKKQSSSGLEPGIQEEIKPSSLTHVRSHKKKKCKVVTIHTQVRSSARLKKLSSSLEPVIQEEIKPSSHTNVTRDKKKKKKKMVTIRTQLRSSARLRKPSSSLDPGVEEGLSAASSTLRQETGSQTVQEESKCFANE